MKFLCNFLVLYLGRSKLKSDEANLVVRVCFAFTVAKYELKLLGNCLRECLCIIFATSYVYKSFNFNIFDCS